MNQTELKTRTKQFAMRIIRVVQSLPKDSVAQVIGRQLLRSGMSVGANYRASGRAKSRADFVFKLSIVEEECYWMELLAEAGIVSEPLPKPLMAEGDEILSITVASIITARQRMSQRTPMAKRSPIPNPKLDECLARTIS